MTITLYDRVRTAAEAWARDYFGVDRVASYAFDDEDDEPGRFIVSLALSGFTEWQVASVITEVSGGGPNYFY